MESSIVRKQVKIITGPTKEDLEKSYALRDDEDPLYVHVTTEELPYPLRIVVLVESPGEGFFFTGIFDDGHVEVRGLWNPEAKEGYVMV